MGRSEEAADTFALIVDGSTANTERFVRPAKNEGRIRINLKQYNRAAYVLAKIVPTLEERYLTAVEDDEIKESGKDFFEVTNMLAFAHAYLDEWEDATKALEKGKSLRVRHLASLHQSQTGGKHNDDNDDDDDNGEKDYADRHGDDNYDNSEFELQRQLAVLLKRKGLDVNSFAPSVRLLAMLEKRGLNEEQIESFVENIDIHCFKHALKPKEFIDTIDNISSLSSSLAIPVPKLAENINQQQNRLDEIKQEIKLSEQRKAKALEDCNVTLDTLEYINKTPQYLTI